MKFVVFGTPRPQGSKRHVGNGVMVESSKELPPWRDSIVWAAREARGLQPTIDGPCVVYASFFFDRPKSHYRTGRNAHLLRDTAPAYPSVKPDADKLARCLCDALTIAGVIKDDARVVSLRVSKDYVGRDARLDVPGITVRVEAL